MRFWVWCCAAVAAWVGQAVLGQAVVNQAWAIEFAGWQGMRVIQQDGAPERMIAADLGFDGRDELIVVNGRQTRLDLYRWLPKKERKPPSKADPDRPNELPLAPEWSRGELPTDEVPLDVVAHDLDGDDRPELLVLTSPSQRIVVYTQQPDTEPEAKGAWKKTGHWDLLQGSPSGQRKNFLLVRDLPEGKHELLVSFEQGIQQLALDKLARATWLSPRESRGRLDWRLADLDGDGDQDLIEWTAQARQTIRWYECDLGAKLLPAQTIYEQTAEGFGALHRGDRAAELLLLGGTQHGLLRRFQLTRGEESELGGQDVLPMPGGAKAAWCGVVLDGQSAIVALDTTQPRLRVHRLTAAGWSTEQTYPTISGVRGLAAPSAVPGTLLLWAKDAADLHRCRWENGRLSYSQPMPQSAEVADRRILALDNVGSIVWWAQRVGQHLDVYTWDKGQTEPVKRRFEGVGSKVEKVAWLGGDSVLMQQAFSNAAQLAVIQDGKTVVTSPAHLTKVDLAEFVLLPIDGKLRSGRLTDGVLQWLDDQLHPIDQVMLTEGQKLAGFVALEKGEAWALEQGGNFIHRLKPDASGILRVSHSIKPPQGSALRVDPVLGTLLVDQDRIVRLSRGQPWELKLLDSLDGRAGRPSGLRENTIHRFLTADVTGEGIDEVFLFDDRRHQATLVERTDDGLKSVAAWQVFDDLKYPYGDESDGATVAEPRMIVAFNADGDDTRDLALLSHDRLVIYVGKER